MDRLNEYYNMGLDMVIMYLPKIITAVIVLIIGMWVAKLFRKGFQKAAARSHMDQSLQKFLASLLSLSLKALVLIIVISMLGIETTSLVAVLGAAGLAIGFALQGSLSNFAGGILILMFKPFKVGDFIEGAGHSGTVHAIEVLNTTLKTPDNKTIIIPNGTLSGNSVINYSAEPKRRVDFVFGISYGDSMKKAKDIIHDIVGKDERILKDPEPFIVISNLGDSSVDITVRIWVETPNYWPVYFEITEIVKETFDAQGISIPFPQMDIHQYKTN